MGNYYKSGSWNIVCDRCSKKVKAEDVQQEWTGFIVCHSCYEMRHPQDFVRARQDKIHIPFARPIPPLVFSTIVYNLYIDDNYYVNPPNQQYIQEII